MARASLALGWVLAAVLLAGPAAAQFGSIFRDDPPRPPADVPGAPPSSYPQYPPSNNYPPNYPDRGTPRPPTDVRSDVPPAQPLPAPMNLPPSSRPGAGQIDSAPLAPPPGADAAPLPQGQSPASANRGPVQTLPGLPPGIRQPSGQPQPGAQPQQADVPPPSDEVVVEPPPQRIANPTAVFSGLDKITGRIITFDVAINETVQFGALQVTPRVCYSRPPTETPNTDGFAEVDEVTLQGEIKRIFTGWMFAASPGLHAVEHPIYDIWLTDCKGGKNPNVADLAPDQPAKPQPVRPQQQRPTQPAQRQPSQTAQPRAQLSPPQQPRVQQPAPGPLPPAIR